MIKKCAKCERPLIVNGVHQGVSFAIDRTLKPGDAGMHTLLCVKCYDLLTVPELKE